MLELVASSLLAVHLLLANLAAAGPLVCIWLHGRYARGDASAGRLGRELAGRSFWSLVAASVLGAGLFGLVWLRGDATYWRAAQAIPASRWWFALTELLFSAFCMAAYLRLWDAGRSQRWLHALLAVVGATNLLYHFPPLFTIVATLAERSAQAPLSPADFRHLLVDPQVLAMVLHVWIASLAVAGVTLMAMAQRAERGGGEPPETSPLAVGGAQIALAATLAQLPVGLWLVVALPSSARDALLGGDLAATATFLLALLSALGLLHYLAAAAFGEVDHRHVRRTTTLLVATLVLMTVAMTRAQRPRADRGDAISRGVGQSARAAI